MTALVWLPLLLSVQDPTPRAPRPDSYADARTEALVAATRAARDRNERLVTAYTASVSQRIGVGIRAASRDRMLYRQELAARVEWYRDKPSRIEVVGAREGIPIAMRKDQIPEDLDDTVRWLVVNPAEDYLRLIGVDDSEAGGRNDDGFVYPLKVGGEADYRYAMGDSTVISLPDGRRIRLVELRILPRRSEWRLISGSLWFDADTYGLVRAVFRPARPFEFRRDLDPADREDVPAWVNPKGEVKYVTLEYGLYENRWWMLRYAAIDAVGSMGNWLGVPFRMERVYSNYEVEGGTPPDPESTFRPAGTTRRTPAPSDSTPADSVRLRQVADSLKAIREACIADARDPDDAPGNRRAVRVRIRDCRRQTRGDTALVVVVPQDTLSLLDSPALGKPILDMGDMISEQEIRGLSGFIDGLPGRPWAARVELPGGVSSLLERARYNRVEALSLAVRGAADFGRLVVDGQARIGLADGWLNLEGGLANQSGGTRWRLGGYRRLAAANPEAKPFGVVNSAFGLFAHRDDGEYFRATGAELVRRSDAGRFVVRAFVERQRGARVETDFSLPHLFGSSAAFRPNILADSAGQYGLSLAWRGDHPFSRTLRVGAETFVEGSGGDFEFGRASLTLRGLITPGGPISVALSGAAGTAVGTVPVQSLFFLGGPFSLRGYDGGVQRGDAFWSGRAEVANSFPAARLSAFTDVGWAGPRDGFWTGKPLIGVGVGASLLDGLVRFDLSRGLRAPRGWRFDLYFDGLL